MAGTETFHWRLDFPHVAYLVTLVVGRYEVFETKWRGTYNPLAYEASLAMKGMNPQQAKDYLARTYTPAQAHEIARSRATLRELGVQF